MNSCAANKYALIKAGVECRDMGSVALEFLPICALLVLFVISYLFTWQFECIVKLLNSYPGVNEAVFFIKSYVVLSLNWDSK